MIGNSLHLVEEKSEINGIIITELCKNWHFMTLAMYMIDCYDCEINEHLLLRLFKVKYPFIKY